MNILTVENYTYNINDVPDEIDDLRFCVLDCSDKDWIDYYFLPLVFLESFYAPSVVLNIGEYSIGMPLDWSIVVCDEDMTDIEVMPLTSLNDRGFYAFVYNPLKDYTPNPENIIITDVYNDVKWYFPKLKNGCILTVPLTNEKCPPCAYFVKELNKIPKNLQPGDLF